MDSAGALDFDNPSGGGCSLYPEPYFSKQALAEMRHEIESGGFEADTILSAGADRPVYGLNIAMGWPLPESVKCLYDKLYLELLSLGRDVYVYPYTQTHITVITLVNFKNSQNPGEEAIKLEGLMPEIIALISHKLLNAKPIFSHFDIIVGPPVLEKRAAFLPILNPTGEVFRLRTLLAPLLANRLRLRVAVPRTIHSTVLRFLKQPIDTNEFVERFESIAAKTCLGTATIKEILLTSETKPYMRSGEKLYRFPLGG